MLVSEIATRVKRQFGDEAGAQITDADIIRWINDAQVDVAINNNLLQVAATTAVIVGQQKYTYPADLLTLRSIRYKGNKLTGYSMEEAEAMIAADSVSSGTPSIFWTYARQFYIWPVPDTAGSADLTVYYTRQPDVLTATTETPELPLQYHARLVEYCIAQAAELDDNLQQFQIKMNQFKQGIDGLKDNGDWEERDEYPYITAAPRDYGDFTETVI